MEKSAFEIFTRNDLKFETDERARKWRELHLHGQAMQAGLLAARLHLAAGDLGRALTDLGDAQRNATKLASDMTLVDVMGKTRHTLATGALDELHLLTAAVHLELGDRGAAKGA